MSSNDVLARELRHAVTVTAHLEARQGRVLKEHGEWHRAMKEHRELIKELDRLILDLVRGFGEFMRERRPE